MGNGCMGNKIILVSLLSLIVTICDIEVATPNSTGEDDADLEQIIHSDKALSEAYEMLNKEYAAALRTYPDKKALEEDQKDWLKRKKWKTKDPCLYDEAPDAPCLLRLYRERIALIRAQYTTYFNGGDKFTGYYETNMPIEEGEIEGVDVGVIVRLIPGNKIKFHAYSYGIEESSFDEIATFVDKNLAVYLDYTVDYCAILFIFDKNRLTVYSSYGCLDTDIGSITGDYFKISNKPRYSRSIKARKKIPKDHPGDRDRNRDIKRYLLLPH